MFYKLIMGDTATDTRIERVVEAKSVFDAIDIVAAELDNPEETELIEAFPWSDQ